MLGKRKNGLNQNGGCVLGDRESCEQNGGDKIDAIFQQIGHRDQKGSGKLFPCFEMGKMKE